jgi:cytochrome c-type biogenesis protein CcmH/NrfG
MHQREDQGPARRRRLGIALALALGVIAIYGQTLGFEFVGFDDDQYVFENAHVKQGLSWPGLAFAFRRNQPGQAAAFPPHPLTWLSHMLDAELYGLAAGGHHATSAVLHALCAALLFAALHALTGSVWRSAAAAALWAWHPLRVESVAWVSERKDVLCAVFAMLTLLAYAHYARRGSRAAWRATCVCFALGLLAKPTLVPLPVGLLLLDHWPLARQRPWRELVLEKWPLFALAAIASLLAIDSQRFVLLTTGEVTLPQRAASAVVALVRHLGLFVWPHPLAPLYPHPYLPTQGGVGLTAGAIAAAVALVAAISALALRARRQPYLAVGWLWFLAFALPTLGLLHAGRQALADRYSQLPMIGLAVAVVWGLAELGSRVRGPALRRALGGVAIAALVVYGCVAWRQVGIWRDSQTLFRHTLAVSPRASVMRINLGTWLRHQRRFAEAEQEYRTALALDPRNAFLHFNLGRALHGQERVDEATLEYRTAATLDPGDARFPYQLGVTFELAQRFAEAAEQYRRAAALDPANPKPRARLASVSAKLAGP